MHSRGTYEGDDASAASRTAEVIKRLFSVSHFTINTSHTHTQVQLLTVCVVSMEMTFLLGDNYKTLLYQSNTVCVMLTQVSGARQMHQNLTGRREWGVLHNGCHGYSA